MRLNCVTIALSAIIAGSWSETTRLAAGAVSCVDSERTTISYAEKGRLYDLGEPIGSSFDFNYTDACGTTYSAITGSRKITGTRIPSQDGECEDYLDVTTQGKATATTGGAVRTFTRSKYVKRTGAVRAEVISTSFTEKTSGLVSTWDQMYQKNSTFESGYDGKYCSKGTIPANEPRCSISITMLALGKYVVSVRLVNPEGSPGSANIGDIVGWLQLPSSPTSLSLWNAPGVINSKVKVGRPSSKPQSLNMVYLPIPAKFPAGSVYEAKIYGDFVTVAATQTGNGPIVPVPGSILQPTDLTGELVNFETRFEKGVQLFCGKSARGPPLGG